MNNRAIHSPLGGFLKKVNLLAEKWRDRFSLPAIGIMLFVFYIFSQRWFQLYLQVRAYQIIFVGLALLLISPAIINRDFNLRRLTMIDLLWLPVLLVIVINIMLVDYSEHLHYLFFYSAGFAFLILAKVDLEEFRPAFSLVTIMALVYACGSIAQYFFTESFNQFVFNFTTTYSQESIERLVDGNYYPGFGFGRKAIAAGYMAMAMGLIFSFWSDGKHKLKLNLELVIFLVFLFGLVITGKRSILLWSLVAMPITFIVLGQGRERVKRIMVALGAGIGALVLLFVALQVAGHLPFLVRLDEMVSNLLQGSPPESWAVRFGLYRDAWLLFLEKPLFGIGWFQFQVFDIRDHHVHNVYLQVLTEMGLTGFIIVMAALFYPYYLTYRAIGRIKIAPERFAPIWRVGMVYSFYYQTFFLLNCLSDNPFFEVTYQLFYIVALALVNSFLLLEKQGRLGELAGKGSVKIDELTGGERSRELTDKDSSEEIRGKDSMDDTDGVADET